MGGWQQSGDRRDGDVAEAISARPQQSRRALAPQGARRTPWLIVAGVAVMLSAIAIADPERVASRADAVAAELERAAINAGFGVSEVVISGHQFAQDSDIYEQLGLGQNSSLIGFKVAAAKMRIEQLSWVARADVARVFPNRLEIKITERTPFAVWTDGGRALLIDASGRALGVVPSTAMPELPRVAGTGANDAASALFSELQHHKEIAASLKLATRVAARRWTLALAGGVTIELPELHMEAALRRFSALKADGAIGAPQTIDLRQPARTVVRAARPAPALPDPDPSSGGRS